MVIIMTVKELSQLYYLNREIEQDKQRLANLEAMATSTTVSITGLPNFKGITDKTAIAVAIADIKGVIETKNKLCITEYNRLMRYIANVEDSYIRQILTFRYVDGFSWIQVALRIGGGNTEDSVRKAHKRFLDKNE